MKPKKKGLVSVERKIFPYLMIAPNMLIFLLFIAVPAVFGLYFSFTNWKGFAAPEFIGLANYATLFQDKRFWQSFLRTCIYVVITLPLIMVIPLGLAMLMVQELRGRGFFRAVFYWPAMISYIIVGISFKFLFGDSTGVINYLLELFGKSSVPWLTGSKTAFFVVILATLWSRSGFYMVTYMSGLQSIPESYYEAADVDGAGGWRKFWYITLPLLKPTTFLVLILSFIDLFKAYGLVISLTGGGPGAATKFVVQYIYDEAFGGKNNLGYASAMSMLLLVIMAIFTMVQFRVNQGGYVDEQ